MKWSCDRYILIHFYMAYKLENSLDYAGL